MPDSPFHHYQVRGHAVERCDATTGHGVWPIAYCDTPERAQEVYTAIDNHDVLIAAIKLVEDRLHKAANGGGPQKGYTAGELKTIIRECRNELRAALPETKDNHQ